jgi:hypothetical protein
MFLAAQVFIFWQLTINYMKAALRYVGNFLIDFFFMFIAFNFTSQSFVELIYS